MPRASAVDLRELGRFFVTGLTATAGNMAAVWLCSRLIPYEVALVVGLACGFSISFLMSKFFAFGSKSLSGAGGEIARFVIVYSTGAAIYWVVAVLARRISMTLGLVNDLAQPFGVLAGAGVMMVATYLGHRFFTYKTFRRSAGEMAGGS